MGSIGEGKKEERKEGKRERRGRHFLEFASIKSCTKKF